MPIEGERRIQEARRRHCEVEDQDCEALAEFRHTYLLEGTRWNPASSAFGADDVSWCSDAEVFTCAKHRYMVNRLCPNGYVWCSTFQAERFPHMFLRWVTVEKIAAKPAAEAEHARA